ncbi:YCF48-related protein [Aequorivita marina]|uniref:T9SS type A sorting domain-containing protein n=1 Tax=Aequorivita marina TaxID=3073654 RepID=UPI002874CA78|nr:YCF48-related protein [Aequorivita sp. S2608]MDS1298375.1 YCF48-related protein [Aequorivita sp. S2608]
MKRLLLLILCCCGILESNGQASWELLNPTPSYKTGKDMHFVSAETGYIITESELLNTQNAGVTWEKMQGVSNANDINFRNELGYIVGNNGYVIKSTDSGDTWNTVAIGTSGNLNTVSIIDEFNIIISSDTKLISTTDGGATWQSFDIPDVSVNKTFFVSATVGHAACKDGTILKTVDGGASWYITESTNIIPTDYYTIYFINESIGFASREFDDVFKTTNGGETWVQIPEINDAIYRFQFLNENEGFITGEYGVIYKTIDGGTTWTFIGFQNGYIINTSMYGIYFQDSDIGYATGARGRIIKTTDGGANWIDYSPTYNDIQKIQFFNDFVGYAATGDIFYKTTDAGITWQNIGSINISNYNSIKFTFVNENVGYASTGGTYGGQMYKTIDGAVSWTPLYEGYDVIDEGISSIVFLDENTGIVSGGYNQRQTRKTTDGGETWETIGYTSYGQMQFVTNDIAYARGGNNSDARLYKSIDGGTSWSLVFEDEDSMGSFDFLNENVGYLVGDYSLLYKTTDGGDSWEELTLPYGFYTLVKFQTEEIGYVADEYGKIFYTEDGGLNWQLNTIQARVKSMAITDNVVYTAGVNGKIFRKLFGTLGNDKVSFRLDFKVYPNPSENSITVQTETEISKIEIYNNLGQLVQVNKDVNKIDITILPSGIYFLKATDSLNTIGVKKIIKR